MFRFANIETLWLLLLIPVFAAAYIMHTRRNQISINCNLLIVNCSLC